MEEEYDQTNYYENRLNELRSKNIEMYPHKFEPSYSIPNYINLFNHLEPGEHVINTNINLAGRISSIRKNSNKLFFYDLHADDKTVQIISNNKIHIDNFDLNDALRYGDIIGVTGFPGKSKTGELSVFTTKIQLLSPCLHMLPSKYNGLNQENRYRKRYLDVMFNPKGKEIFYKRSQIINYIRRYLDGNGFLEVETPMMNMCPGGANARPFKTFHNDLNIDMFMRIAPELYLKMLVIGGFDRVYEIGRQFRNESIDLTHNPEFTTCEFYWSYKDYNDLIQITEDIISGMVKVINKSYKINYTKKSGEVVEIDFTPPFKKVSMIEEIERLTNCKIPIDYESDETNQFLLELCEKYQIICSPPTTTSRLFDKLAGHFIEDNIINPTFICDHPTVMSPLSKSNRNHDHIVERFELFVLGKEICNAYTELNDPIVQRERFMSQMKDKEKGNLEAQMLDEDFINALEYGLPPTGGWGMGIDRMTMFLTDNHNIKEVLLFPAMKPIVNNNE